MFNFRGWQEVSFFDGLSAGSRRGIVRIREVYGRSQGDEGESAQEFVEHQGRVCATQDGWGRRDELP
jgi:hypothetical protein